MGETADALLSILAARLLQAEECFYSRAASDGTMDQEKLGDTLLGVLPHCSGDEEFHRVSTRLSGSGAHGRINFEDFVSTYNILCTTVQSVRVHDGEYADDDFEEDTLQTTLQETLQETLSRAYAEDFEEPDEDADGADESHAAPPEGRAPPARQTPWSVIGLSEVELGERLGSGGMGAVHAGTWRGQPVAVKTLHLDGASSACTADQLRALETELLVHAPLDHPSVVKLIGASLVPSGGCIVLEQCARSLFDRLHRDPAELDRRRAVDLAAQVAEGFVYLHARSPAVVHRDLKPHNVLLTSEGRAKISDFGLVDSREPTAGTPNYMAPELLLAKPHSAKVDLFAFGVLLNEMFAREVPWDGYEPAVIKDKVVGGERPPSVQTMPSACVGLLRKCWHQDARLRPSFSEAAEILRRTEESLPVAALGVAVPDSLDNFASLQRR